MIIHFKKNISADLLKRSLMEYEGVSIEKDDCYVVITSSKYHAVDEVFSEYVIELHDFENDMQLSNYSYTEAVREIRVKDLVIGGDSNNTVVITGPCSVESYEQIDVSAELLVKHGLGIMRAGCFKPRTSPYSFQGMGEEGLSLLGQMREKYGLSVITEIRDSTHADLVIEKTDLVQIGAKAMYDQGILRKCGQTDKPILLKRGFGSTLQEFVQAAEFILSGGNENVILCERGIRTFETKTRFTLDLCGVSYLKEYTNLPVVLDPSHAMGYAYGVPDLARACVAMGVDGLLIETHPDPTVAKSDASQQLNHQQFSDLLDSLTPIANSIGRTIV